MLMLENSDGIKGLLQRWSIFHTAFNSQVRVYRVTLDFLRV